MTACALFKGQTCCHLGYLYYAFKKDKPGWGGGLVPFKWYARDKRGLRKRKCDFSELSTRWLQISMRFGGGGLKSILLVLKYFFRILVHSFPLVT